MNIVYLFENQSWKVSGASHWPLISKFKIWNSESVTTLHSYHIEDQNQNTVPTKCPKLLRRVMKVLIITFLLTSLAYHGMASPAVNDDPKIDTSEMNAIPKLYVPKDKEVSNKHAYQQTWKSIKWRSIFVKIKVYKYPCLNWFKIGFN